jgi:hypothetical protein
MRALLVAGVLLAAVAMSRADDSKSDALLNGDLPEDPARALVQRNCLLCHTADYITQQRLTEGQWQRTVDKMRKFGTPATDAEAEIDGGLSRALRTVDLPPPRSPRAALPPGSVSGK